MLCVKGLRVFMALKWSDGKHTRCTFSRSQNHHLMLSQKNNYWVKRVHIAALNAAFTNLETYCWKSCSTGRRRWWCWACQALSWTPYPLGPTGLESPAVSRPLQRPTMKRRGKRKRVGRVGDKEDVVDKYEAEKTVSSGLTCANYSK